MTKSYIVIIGAGFAGRSIAQEIQAKGILGRVTAFVDDDEKKIDTKIDGIPVIGPISKIREFKSALLADEALIAIPSADKAKLHQVYNYLKDAGFMKIRILPSISQIVDGDAHLIQTREIDPQDLLGRTPVTIPLKESLSYLRGKRVLITGAGGSIGSELARQLLSGGAERLYLFGHGENSIYEIDRELRILQEEGVGDKAIIVPVIGDLQDEEYIRFIVKRLRADVIFHCAAYKHVPLVEGNPVEAIKNNVFGTKNLIEACREHGTPRFVLISTDKAVEPVSVYGASKQLAERIVLENDGKNPACMVVRFGNVLGSRGSIVPLFRKQIQKGGPVTITHRGMERFFMTIPEAASLVLKAGGVGAPGGLYILDMGEPICIEELAKQMISFYGYTPDVDIEIKYIGARPGEKITERLWEEGESPAPTDQQRILSLPDNRVDSEELANLLEELRRICFFDPSEPEHFRNRRKLKEIIHRYIPTVETDGNEPEY